jgi:copper chaperone CopZ
MTTQSLKITGLTCVACTKLTAKRLKSIDGVEDASVDLDSGRAQITANRPITLDEVRTALSEGSYNAEEYHE